MRSYSPYLFVPEIEKPGDLSIAGYPLSAAAFRRDGVSQEDHAQISIEQHTSNIDWSEPETIKALDLVKSNSATWFQNTNKGLYSN
jgi:hypothetical protein